MDTQPRVPATSGVVVTPAGVPARTSMPSKPRLWLAALLEALDRDDPKLRPIPLGDLFLHLNLLVRLALHFGLGLRFNRRAIVTSRNLHRGHFHFPTDVR